MPGTWTARIGTAFLVVAGMFLALAVFMVASPTKEDAGVIESATPGLFFAAVAGIPGWVMRKAGRKRRADWELESALVGYVRSFDRFTAAELAGRVGRTEMEVENLLARVSADPSRGLDLVFHRPDRSWIHRGRIADDHVIVDRCGSCGANIGKQLILHGEEVRCTFCDQVLAVA